MKKFLLGLMAVCMLLGASAVAEGVVISEVMSRNTVYAPVNGEYAGWVEVYNASGEVQDISGWYLTDSEIFKNAFRFTDTVLQPGEAVLVYAAGVDSDVHDPVHVAQFKVSKAGDTIMLTDHRGDAVDAVQVPALGVDEAFARDIGTGEWASTYEATPGLANTRGNYAAIAQTLVQADTGVVISEAMASCGSWYAESDHPDWIELHNRSAQRVDVTGWVISDDPEEPQNGFVLPETVLEGGEYRVIFADGKGYADESGALHANFKLSQKGETLVLLDAQGRVASRMAFGEMGEDVSCSRQNDGAFTTDITPSPGWPNTENGARQAILSTAGSTEMSFNESGLYISEVMAGTDIVNLDEMSYDWVEISNLSGAVIDLSGYGLSDREDRPRKWQFPQGASIAPGEYLLVALTGDEDASSNVSSGKYRATFALSAGETVVLAKADGTVIDRVGLGVQRQNVSFGRPATGDVYAYFASATPGASNPASGYDAIASDVIFSVPGGVVQGDSVTVSLSAQSGMDIYYTLDCTEPTPQSMRYTGPITLTSNTVVRAVAWRDGAVFSQIATQTYIFGEPTELRVVSVVAEPEELFGSNGIISKSKKNRSVNANVEIYSDHGDPLIAQGCRMTLMGASSIKQSQKSMRLAADAAYGDSMFRAALFDEREYTEYSDIVLRCSGQDSWHTRMHDSILTSTLRGTAVPYQETEVCVVYLNGEFYGHMNMRERVNKDMLAQFHDWDDPQNVQILEQTLDGIAVVEGPMSCRDDWRALVKWASDADMTQQASVDKLAGQLDIENYLTYVAFQQFIANNDLGNVRWYRNPAQDGKWRFIAYDTDLSFEVDQNSFSRWLTAGGVGSITEQDNTLFRAMMKNTGLREQFLTIIGDMLAGPWSTQSIQAAVDARYALIHDDAVRTFEHYGEGGESKLNRYVTRFYKYAAARPAKYLAYIKETAGLSEADMQRFFGEAIDRINGVAPADDADAYVDEQALIDENPRGDAEAEDPGTEETAPEAQEFVDLEG